LDQFSIERLIMKTAVGLAIIAIAHVSLCVGENLSYTVVDTGQKHCFNNSRIVHAPKTGETFYGQDAQYAGVQPSYKDNDDGTISDLNTGLMWTQDPGAKRIFALAKNGALKCHVGGYRDWRLPTIKELYSLIQFNGTDPDPRSRAEKSLTPFIDRTVFKFQYGNVAKGERIIDSQFASSTLYVSTTMGVNKTMFGVNFADGRIKGYPVGPIPHRREKTYYVLYVRDNPAYGKNKYTDPGDGTIIDKATGLIWSKRDSGRGMDWPTALEYAENLNMAGYSDWRLPNAKELHSIVDYTRSPDSTVSAAIDPVFDTTEIINEDGKKDFGCYWTSSSHPRGGGSIAAVYIAFGRCLGWMSDRRSSCGRKTLMDVHGAGSQRTDPKVGDASIYPQGRGPQGDVIRIDNIVRCVRGGQTIPVVSQTPVPVQTHPSGLAPSPNRKHLPSDKQDAESLLFISRLDRNGDVRISRVEFDGPSNAFTTLDENCDGYLSEHEAPHRHGHPAQNRDHGRKD
jgi:hypothetical protein